MKKLNFKNINYYVILATSSSLGHRNNVTKFFFFALPLSEFLATPVVWSIVLFFLYDWK